MWRCPSMGGRAPRYSPRYSPRSPPRERHPRLTSRRISRRISRRMSLRREEDETIVAMVQAKGQKWSRIAAMLPGRTDDAVRNRRAQQHNNNNTTTTTIAAMLPGRTDDAVRNRRAPKRAQQHNNTTQHNNNVVVPRATRKLEPRGRPAADALLTWSRVHYCRYRYLRLQKKNNNN